MNKIEIKTRLMALGKTQVDMVEAIAPKVYALGYTSLTNAELCDHIRKAGTGFLTNKGIDVIELVAAQLDEWERERE